MKRLIVFKVCCNSTGAVLGHFRGLVKSGGWAHQRWDGIEWWFTCVVEVLEGFLSWMLFLGAVFNVPLAGCSQGRSTSCTQGQTPPPAWLCTCVRVRQRRRRRSRTPDRRSCRRGARTRPPPSWVTPKPSSSVPWRWEGQCPVRAELLLLPTPGTRPVHVLLSVLLL